MHILMTGAAGMIGRKLTARLVKDGALNGKPIEKLTLIDLHAPDRPDRFSGAVETIAADVANPAAMAGAVNRRPDVI
ncbi:MAG TPA: NAD-dependent epimerase/dehydratase family protein, partial [Xanthobacteraceae bacterium]